MESPIRVHISDEYDVNCMRPNKWSNPFSSKEFSTAKYKTNSRRESVEKHYEWLKKNTELMEQIDQLSGKRLACCCKKGQNCHVDNVIKLFNEKNNGLW